MVIWLFPISSRLSCSRFLLKMSAFKIKMLSQRLEKLWKCSYTQSQHHRNLTVSFWHFLITLSCTITNKLKWHFFLKCSFLAGPGTLLGFNVCERLKRMYAFHLSDRKRCDRCIKAITAPTAAHLLSPTGETRLPLITQTMLLIYETFKESGHCRKPTVTRQLKWM